MRGWDVEAVQRWFYNFEESRPFAKALKEKYEVDGKMLLNRDGYMKPVLEQMAKDKFVGSYQRLSTTMTKEAAD